MTGRQRGIAIWVAWIAFAIAGCSHESGPAPTPAPAAPEPHATAPSAVAGQVGEGPVSVYGASVYSPGQEIYKQLRQEDSLMAFLACQGEPDRLEVLENPGAAPRIILEYTRPGLRRGTVEIAPSAAGYYAARPIDPSGSLKSTARKPAKPAAKPKPAPKPKAAPTPAPTDEPETQADEPEPTPSTPAGPQPSAAERDECPIEPWRDDCRALCTPGATWEWCSYRK
jgi:hypothetical protein